MTIRTALVLLCLCALRPAGGASAATYTDLLTQAEALAASGETDSAGAVLTSALDTALSTYGESDTAVSFSFFEDGIRTRYYFRTNEEAESLYTRALRVREAIDREDTEETARILFRLSRIKLFTGKGEEAMELTRRSLAMREALLGPDDPDLAQTLLLAGFLCRTAAGDAEEAIGLLERALPIYESFYGPESEETGYCLLQLGVSYGNAFKHEEAERVFKRKLALDERLYGPESVEVALSLNNLASIYKRRYDYGRAVPMYERSIAIREKVSDPADPELGRALENLARVYLGQYRYAESEAAYKRVLEIYETAYGRDSVDYGFAMGFLGFLYKEMGRYAEAEPLLTGSAEIIEHHYGVGDPRTCGRLNDLALLHKDQGRLPEAEAAFRRIIGIKEDHGQEDPQLAIYLYNLAGLCRDTGRYSEAVSMLKRAIAIWEEVYGADHGDVGGGLIELGETYRMKGNYAEAEAAFKRAEGIHVALFGESNVECARAQQGLADVYLDQGMYAQAESYLNRALAIREPQLDPNHPSIAETLESTLRLCRHRKEYGRAVELAERIWRMRSISFLENADVLSERDALTFAADLRRSVDALLTAYDDFDAQDEDRVADIARVIISSKGQVSDGIFERRRDLVEETDSTTLAIADRLRNVKVYLSQLYVRGPGEDIGDHRARLDSLGTIANALEADLARQSASFRRRREAETVGPEKLASLLPEGSGLLEFLRYDYMELPNETPVGRYLVLVLRPDEEPALVDLGGAERIDAAVEKWRAHLLRLAESGRLPNIVDQQEYERLSRDLYAAVWKPVERYIEGSRTVFVAPDGALNLIAFAGLEARAGEYLIERHALHYLSAGRDLARLEYEPEQALGLFALGDPDYGASATNRVAAMPAPEDSVIQVAFATRNLRSGCGALSDMEVPSLPGTRREVELVSRSWEENTVEPVVTCFGLEASEEFFKAEAPGKRVIHLATHGYFLGGACRPDSAGTDYVGENPLLLSGLFLAGANLHGDGADSLGADDGILTAYEVSAMDLKGTGLVVLSACETGLGEVAQGEGVYGLRRAFQMAGARTVVSALWPVSDEATADMMGGLYTRGDTPLPDTMRRIQLEKIEALRSERNIDHVFTWGAFIGVGDWR